ncbi:MAG: glycosyltransferase family 39 protein, partial [Methanobacterium sp.]
MDKINKNSSTYKSSLNNFLNHHKISIIYLLLLTIIVSFITYYRIMIQIEMGPVSDSVVFLANAITYAGQGTGYSNLLFPPFFSFMVSLFFRLGYVYSSTLFVVDGLLYIFGVIGLYLLLRMRFNELESFLGGLLYATFPIVIVILGIGLSDLGSVSISIWAIYFLVLSIKRDSRFFYLAFPFAMLAFLTRYNSALLIFPILGYLLMNRDKVNLKNIIIGIIAAILSIIPVLIFFYERFGNIIYPFINFASTSTIVTVANKNPY